MHEGARYSCDQCEYTTALPSNLKKHEAKHVVTKYPCDQCDFIAGDSYNLKTHKAYHHEKAKYSCDECQFATPHLAHMKRHIKYFHQVFVLPVKELEDNLEYSKQVLFILHLL